MFLFVFWIKIRHKCIFQRGNVVWNCYNYRFLHWHRLQNVEKTPLLELFPLSCKKRGIFSISHCSHDVQLSDFVSFLEHIDWNPHANSVSPMLTARFWQNCQNLNRLSFGHPSCYWPIGGDGQLCLVFESRIFGDLRFWPKGDPKVSISKGESRPQAFFAFWGS